MAADSRSAAAAAALATLRVERCCDTKSYLLLRCSAEFQTGRHHCRKIVQNLIDNTKLPILV